MSEPVHLHVDTHPQTLRLLVELVGQRGHASLGYEVTEGGAFVDWERLAAGSLSTTEVATVHIARGCATLERAGGLPPHPRGSPGRAGGGVIPQPLSHPVRTITAKDQEEAMSSTGRDAHRQEFRDASSHITITLPYKDDEPGQSISVLEDLFLGIIPEGAECPECGPQQELDEACLPASLANGCLGDHAATDALGRMTLYTTHCHRHGPAVQPVAPNGRFELVPLYFFRLRRTDHVQLTSALADLPQVEDLIVRNYTGSHDAAGQLLARAQRLRAFLDLPWDDDVDVLHALLDRAPPDLPWDTDRESWFTLLKGVSIHPTERVVLTPDEHAAYERVTERILATWHGDDPLERVLYRGA